MEPISDEPKTGLLSVSEVTPETLAYVWTEIEPMVKRGLSHGQGDGTTSNHMLAAIAGGQMSLWVIHRGREVVAGIVLSFSEHDVCKKLFVEMLAGKDMPVWADQLEGLLKDVKELIGATCIEASCRPGLAKFLSGRGWKEKAIVMEMK